jgi:hypothetical protein
MASCRREDHAPRLIVELRAHHCVRPYHECSVCFGTRRLTKVHEAP